MHEAETLRQGLTDAGTRKPDLIILDLGLPDGDGMDFLRDLRGWSKVPVIVLSARVGEQDKIEALDAGADDYLTKPFGVGELLARVRAASRRRRRSPATGRHDIRIRRREGRSRPCAPCTKRGQPVHLTPIEYRLLTLLIANRARCSRIGKSCARCGVPPMPRMGITCGCTWGTFGRSSRTSRPSPGTS